MIYRVYKFGDEFKVVVFKTLRLDLDIISDPALDYENLTSLASWENTLREDYCLTPDDAKKQASEFCIDKKKQEKAQNNFCRAKSTVTELALCNNFEYFVTLTLDESKTNRYDLTAFIHDLGVWIGNFNKKYNAKLKYILIPEEHKKGGWHMHGLFSGVPPNALTINEHGYLDLPYYRRRFGFISLSKIKDKSRCARYITKYICKDFTARLFDLGGHLYYASHGLNRREFVLQGDLNSLPADFWSNDYVSLKWFDNEESLNKWIKEN